MSGANHPATGRGFTPDLATVPLANALLQEIDPDRLVIQARDRAEGLATSGHEILGATHADLLKCLKAVRNKCWRDDQQALLALGGEALVFEVGVGLEPRLVGQPRLEGDGPLRGIESGPGGEGLGGGDALGLVAGGVGGTAGVAAIDVALRSTKVLACFPLVLYAEPWENGKRTGCELKRRGVGCRVEFRCCRS